MQGNRHSYKHHPQAPLEPVDDVCNVNSLFKNKEHHFYYKLFNIVRS